MKADLPHNEIARLELLQQLAILDTLPEQNFDGIAELARYIANTSIATVTLVDSARQWFKAKIDLDIDESPREIAICAHAILNPFDITYLPDTLLDKRVADSPLVTAENGIRFYAGVPLVVEGLAVGTLCVMDRSPKQLSESQLLALKRLGQQTEALLSARLIAWQSIAQKNQLAFEKQRLDAIIIGTQLGIFEWDMQSDQTIYNSHLFNLLGLPEGEQYTADFWRQRIYPDDFLSVNEKLFAHINGEAQFFDVKLRMQHKDRHYLWLHIVGKIMSWSADGKPLLMFGTYRDISNDKAKEAEIQDTRSWLQAVINSATEAAMISTGPDGIISLFNTGAERMLGYRAAELIGRHSPGIFHEPVEIGRRGAQLSAEYQQDIQGFDVFVYKARQGLGETRQWTYICKNGERKQVRLSVSAVHDGQGTITGYLGVAIDITQLEQLHHALLLSEQRHRSMLENLPGVVYRCMNDDSWTMLFISDEVEKMTGYPAKSFIRNRDISFAKLTLKEDSEIVRQAVEIDLVHNRRFSVEYRIRHLDGSVRWIQELGRGIFDNDGSLLYIDGFIWDITVQKQVQLALRTGEQKLNSLYQFAPLAILLSRFSDGQAISANPHFFHLRNQSDSTEIPTLQVMLHLSPKQMQQRLERLNASGRYGPEEFELAQYNGERLHVVLSEVLIATAEGEQQVWSIIQDITERKRIEQMKNQFVSMVSHELRTPLTSISGALGLMSGGVLGEVPAMMQNMLVIAKENSNKLTQLINDLLDIDKLVAGKMQFEMTRLAVKPLLQQAILHNQPYADKYQIKILLDAPQDGMIDIDPMRLHQILANLLSNAAKFSPPTSEIHVGLEIADQQVQISVTDQGPGIPDAFRLHIFEKFSQADSADARSKGGTGLGLAIVKELTNRMGGDISFTTSPTGTSFTLSFALRGAAESNKPTILVVEDDDQIAQFIRENLENAGYQVVCCADLGSARRAMTLQSFVAVSLDLHLPDGHASTLFHELRSNPQHKDIPVLIATVEEQADPKLFDDFKGVSWLAKPLLAEQLVQTLRKLTGH